MIQKLEYKSVKYKIQFCINDTEIRRVQVQWTGLYKNDTMQYLKCRILVCIKWYSALLLSSSSPLESSTGTGLSSAQMVKSGRSDGDIGEDHYDDGGGQF